jgi:hypothetical protein
VSCILDAPPRSLIPQSCRRIAARLEHQPPISRRFFREVEVDDVPPGKTLQACSTGTPDLAQAPYASRVENGRVAKENVRPPLTLVFSYSPDESGSI